MPSAPPLTYDTTLARRVARASFIGTTIEWYDFFIHATAARWFGPRRRRPPHAAGAGQGACQALEDAACLAQGLAANPEVDREGRRCLPDRGKDECPRPPAEVTAAFEGAPA